MPTILITGSNGFIGKNLVHRLRSLHTYDLKLFDTSNSFQELEEFVRQADFIFHLAGVNIPTYPGALQEGNVMFTRRLISLLQKHHKTIPIIVTSSTQAELDNPYGKSKLEMENHLLTWSEKSHAPVLIYRLSNVFGKWSRPNYNSVVATFCHRLSAELELEINDPDHLLQLIPIDELISNFVNILAHPNDQIGGLCSIATTYPLTVGELAKKLIAFHESRKQFIVPDFSSPLDAQLYATYLSFQNPVSLIQTPTLQSDVRGDLFEFIKSDPFGQIFFSTTHPGVTRGNHYHHTKVEKFLVLQGTARITLFNLNNEVNLQVIVTGEHPQIIDIPPGFIHSITNIGETDLLTVFWANQIFDPEHPDTYIKEE